MSGIRNWREKKFALALPEVFVSASDVEKLLNDLFTEQEAADVICEYLSSNAKALEIVKEWINSP